MLFVALNYSTSLYFVANTYYSTISHSSIQSLPLVLYNEGCLNFWTHPSAPVSKKTAASKVFGNLPVKDLWWSHF